MAAGDEIALPNSNIPAQAKFTAENRKKILQAVRGGMSLKVAAGRCRIKPNTLEKWLYVGEVASDEATGEEGKLRTLYLDVLEAASNGVLGLRVQLQGFAVDDSKVAMWLAERLYPEEFGKVTSARVEHTGVDGGPIEITANRVDTYKKMSDEDLDAAISLQEKYSADVVDAEIIEKG